MSQKISIVVHLRQPTVPKWLRRLKSYGGSSILGGVWFGENWEDNRLGEDAEMYCMSKKC